MSLYSPHPSIAHWKAMTASLEARTGRDLDAWLAALKRSGLQSEPELRQWLKEQHGLGMSTIDLILHATKAQSCPEESVDAIFRGEKATLRPLYEDILAQVLALGDDVKACPCATIIPFYRKHVFAQVKVPNRTAIHLGLALGDLPPEGMLVSTGGYQKSDRITHRLELDVNRKFGKDHKRWLRRAYERDEKSATAGRK